MKKTPNEIRLLRRDGGEIVIAPTVEYEAIIATMNTSMGSGRILPQVHIIAERLVDAYNTQQAMLDQLEAAVVRIKLANSEGDDILSAWLPDAEAIIEAAGIKELATIIRRAGA